MVFFICLYVKQALHLDLYLRHVMQEIYKRSFYLPYYIKYFGIVFSLYGVFIAVRKIIKEDIELIQVSSIPLLCGLMMIFFSREKINDERIVNLKYYSLTSAFMICYSLLLLSLFIFKSAGWDQFWGVLTAFDSLVIVLLMAIALFKYSLRKL